MTTNLLVNQSNMLTSRQLAKILNIHINTARKWGDNGTIPCHRIGKRKDRRFCTKDVQIFLDNCLEVPRE